MKSLPLFHRISGQPVIVLGEGGMAQPKRRLVERAGGKVIGDFQQGIDAGARLAFVAHDDAAKCESDAIRLRSEGLLVNVVDRPDLCDFTTPSLLERDPVIVAVGTSGASAGLAKQLRLRLEGLLPADLGNLAQRLSDLRDQIKGKWPQTGARRQALDNALSAGGVLDPLRENASEKIDGWLAGDAGGEQSGPIELLLTSDDPDDLTLRQARLLGSADAVFFDPAIPAVILDRARADAFRAALPFEGDNPAGLILILHREISS